MPPGEEPERFPGISPARISGIHRCGRNQRKMSEWYKFERREAVVMAASNNNFTGRISKRFKTIHLESPSSWSERDCRRRCLHAKRFV